MSILDLVYNSPFYVRATATWSSVLVTLLGGIALLLAGIYLYVGPYKLYSSGFRNLKSPPGGHWFFGHIRSIIAAPPMGMHALWAKEYGSTYRYGFLLNRPRFYTEDRTALNFMLTHNEIFQKPAQTRQFLVNMLGNGVLTAEGHDHKRQRKVLNSSFSPAAVREMVPIFLDKAGELRDKLMLLIDDESIEASPTPAKEEDKVVGGRKVDIMKFLGQATLDVIGVAGFNYDFKALSEPKNELAEAYREMLTAGQGITAIGIIQALVPGAGLIPTRRTRVINSSKAISDRIGMQLIREKKAAIKSALSGNVEKGSDIGKDLLSILIKANMAEDLRPDQRLTDAEVLAQITTFMLAGNETSSTALTWTLYLLSLHPESQDRLRAELAEVPNENPSMDELNALPYLDAVIREGLRLYAPVPSTIRNATQDVEIPLGVPIQDRYGKTLSSVRLNKGTTMLIPIHTLNASTEIWGSDGAEYNPDRYTRSHSKEQQEALNSVPGVWGNMLTFLGGTRNCIGYRFALVEIKAMMFVLLRSFTFEPLPSKPEFERKSDIVMRPRVKGEEKAGLQMPLMIKPLSA